MIRVCTSSDDARGRGGRGCCELDYDGLFQIVICPQFLQAVGFAETERVVYYRA